MTSDGPMKCTHMGKGHVAIHAHFSPDSVGEDRLIEVWVGHTTALRRDGVDAWVLIERPGGDWSADTFGMMIDHFESVDHRKVKETELLVKIAEWNERYG